MAEPQKELFDEFNESGKTRPSLGKKLIPEKTFTINIAYDKLIVVALAAIITLSLMFAFGFEQGRQSIFRKVRLNQCRTPKAVVAPAAAAPRQGAPKERAAAKPYVIQLATYKSKELVQKEMEALKKKNLPVTVLGVNGRYEIWVGEYADPKEATATLNALKKSYKDCYIRKR